MGYQIKRLPQKKSAPQWKIQFVSYKKEHVKNFDTQNPRVTWDIPQERWKGLGFRSSMTFDQAKIRQLQLNAQLHVGRKEEYLRRSEQERKKLETRARAFMPAPLKEEFELRYFSGTSLKRTIRNKTFYHWKAAQEVILSSNLDPSEWTDHRHVFYDYFHEKKWSLSYIGKILSLMNSWGFFISRKLGLPFLPVASPRGLEKSRLLDAFFSKSNQGKQSDPMTPQALEAIKNDIASEHYHWLYLSLWLGLRPHEVDQLKNPSMFKILKTDQGHTILWIYQTKLISIPPRYRWKLIPLIFEEQLEVLRIIEGKSFRRPLVKTVHRHLGARINLYGGRKGFTDLMLSKGQSFFDISQWLGHSTMQRTWSNYKSRRVVHFQESVNE